MNAKEARELVRLSLGNGLNFQRKHILGRIEVSAQIGKTYVVLDEEHIVLFEDDYKYFEELGYEVLREVRKPGYIQFGMIRWSE